MKSRIISSLLVVILVVIAVIPAFATTKTAYVDTSSTNYGILKLRKTKSTTATVLKKIPHGTPLSVTYTNRSDTWYKTSYDGATGYVKSEFISFTQPPAGSGSAWESRYGSRTYSTSDSNHYYAGVANLQNDINLFYETFTEYYGGEYHNLTDYVVYPLDVDGYFGTNTNTAVYTFQQKVGLSPDGVAGPNTKAALYDWYLAHR